MNKKYYYWIGILTIFTIAVMLLFGKTNFNITDPFYIGFEQYIDIGAGILFVILLGIGFIIGLFTFKKK